ncbi:substrate-binding periplasmic protein [Dongshaea marina]|uniref:substrate-binding periplasmic protein n=1 Tax=Dongshaea marina TaxID=2047966 RepID=UPI00131F25D2|nr:transporter substrate-binding domain-containing protein [Dongshaea marina]
MNAAVKCEQFTINGAQSWHPYSYFKNGNLGGPYMGLIADVTRAVMSELGVKVIAGKPRPWKRLLKDLEFGQLDGLSGAYFTELRAKQFIYSPAIGNDKISIFVKKGHEFNFQTLADLLGKKGLRPAGGSYGETFDKYAREHLLFIESNEDQRMASMLMRGRADYMVLAYHHGKKLLRQMGLEDKIVALKNPVTSNNVYLLFSRSSPCAELSDDFKETFNKMMENGKLDPIYQRYHQ